MIKAALQTNLIGQEITPDGARFAFYRSADGRVYQAATPSGAAIWKLKPTQSREYFATIRAAWVEEGKLKIVFAGPHGDTQDGYLEHYKILGKGERATTVDDPNSPLSINSNPV